MEKKFFVSVALLGFFISAELKSQDYHFSHFDMVSLFMNPATTGMYDGKKGDYRITSDYRSQWRALGIKPFTAAFISYDMPLRKWGNKWGCGGYIVQDHSGIAKFQTLNVMASGAYNIMDGTKEHYLTAGLQMGIFYKSFDPSSYTYDVQWSDATGSFDQTIYNEENFERTGMVKFDANIGVRYGYMPLHKKYRPFASFSVYHLTMPNESFTGTKSRVPMRFNMYTACEFDINESFIIQPRILYMNQRKANELDLGFLLYYKIKNSTLDALAGVDYRNKDALIFHIGFRQENSLFRFSYDLNTSYLNNYTSGRGAWEFSLILIGIKNQPLFKPMF